MMMSGVSEKNLLVTSDSKRPVFMPALFRALPVVLSLALGLLVWWLLSRIVPDPVLFASPAYTWESFVELARTGDLYVNILASLKRIWGGFLLGAAVAIPLGLAMGAIRWVRTAVEPYIEFFRFIPPIALLPLAILWFGIDETSKVFLIFYGTVWIVLLNTLAGFFAIDPVKIRAAKMLGLTPYQVFTRVMVPSTIPYIITGMRVGMGNSFMTVVSAEMLAAQSGVGYLIFSSRIFYQTGNMFVGLILLGLMGYVTDRIFRIASVRWLGKYGVRNTQRTR